MISFDRSPSHDPSAWGPASSGAWVRPATVLGAGADGRVFARLDDGTVVNLVVATQPVPSFEAGDRVLATGERTDASFLIGVLETKSPAKLVTKQGVSARIAVVEGRERLEIRDADDRLLVSVDPSTGGMVLSSPRGPFAIRSEAGDIELQASGAVRVAGGERVELRGGHGDDAATFSLEGALSKLTSDAIDVTARRARAGIADVKLAARTLASRIEDARHEYGRVETVAERVVERAKTAMRRVEELSELAAGRIRSVATGGMTLRAGHASLEADDEVRIDGKHINLG